MNKISSNSTVNEIAEVGNGFIDLSKKYPLSEDAYFVVIHEKLSAKTNELIGKINAGWLASELQMKDEVRDLDIRAIFYEVEAKCMRRPSEAQQKALRIKAVLDRYGMKITGGGYTNESARIRAMLSDLRASELDDCRGAVTELEGLLVNLDGSQADFDISASKYIEDKTERENSKSASVVAKELKEIINNELCGYLAAMTLAKPETYKVFTDFFATLIDQNNSKVRDRIAAQKRKREETEATAK